MPRGTQLSQLVTMFRAEVGMSSNVGQGVNSIENIKLLLARTQRRLYNDYEWPFLIIDRDEALVDGSRYYSFDADLNFERIIEAHVQYSTTWRPVLYGIDVAQYNELDSDDDERQDPVQRWRHYENNQYEVWPIPASNDQTLRFRGIKKLSGLVADSDTADLDDDLIVLYSAAEWLQKSGSPEAEAKLAAATGQYKNLRGNANKTKMFVLGGETPMRRHVTGPLSGTRLPVVP